MDISVFNEADKIWKTLSKGSDDHQLNFSLEVHKKLLSLFQVGDYYYYIFNVKRSTFEFISDEITQVLGFQPAEIDVPFFLNNIHPDDQSWFINFEKHVAEFFKGLTKNQIQKYKVRYDYRVKKKDGTYIRILQQVVTIQVDDNQGILMTLGVHTDITHIKNEGQPVLSFIGLDGEPSFIGVNVKKVFSLELQLTRREREILSLIIDGKKSEEISRLLFISRLTVDTHRKNLLKKTNSSNMASLISKAVKHGLA